MRVQDVMSRGVNSVPTTATTDQARTLMRTKGIHHLVVLEGSEIAGVISARDLGSRNGAAVGDSHLVRELMTTNVVTVTPETPVRKAANLMRGRSIGCVVVARKGRIVGIVTTADLLELIGRGIERPVATTQRRTLSHRAPHRKRHQSTGAW